MKRLHKLLATTTLVLSSLGAAVPVYADDQATTDEAPIIYFYRQRVKLAHIDIDKAKSIAEMEASKYDRCRRLYAQRAISLEEMEEQRSKSEVATLSIRVRQTEAKEQEALLAVAIERSNAGLVMPICTVDRRND